MKLPLVKNRCRHFNGIQNDCCEAGVRYLDVRDASGVGPFSWPCSEYNDGRRANAITVCEKRSFLTVDEQAAERAEIDAAVMRAIADMAAGRCHVCGAPAEPSTIVGHCRYAACGHRVGQVAMTDEEHDAALAESFAWHDENETK